jgi:RND family efflux transporter MFP subunit
MASTRNFSGFLALVVGVGAAGGAIWWLNRPEEIPPAGSRMPPFVVPVTTVAVELGDVVETVELIGDVVAPERARGAFERAGRIRELPIRVGDLVKAGAVLARLDDRVMEESVKAADASLSQAREMSDLARRDAQRAHELRDVDMSEAAIDRADAVARNEAAKVEQMEADLALARARLAQGELLAPFDAVVTERPVALGSYVAAGDACCELLSLERREIRLELPPGVAGRVSAGAEVTLTGDALPGFEARSELFTVLPSAQVRERSFIGVVRLGSDEDPERRLQPGMFVRARVALRAAHGAPTVPVDAVLDGEGGARLAVVAPGETPTAAFVPVVVLARDGERAAVQAADGASLAVGDAVILAGKENVYPGALLALPAASLPKAGGP